MHHGYIQPYERIWHHERIRHHECIRHHEIIRPHDFPPDCWIPQVLEFQQPRTRGSDRDMDMDMDMDMPEIVSAVPGMPGFFPVCEAGTGSRPFSI